MNLPKFALEHKAVVLIATLILVLAGVVVFQTAPRKEDPDLLEIRYRADIECIVDAGPLWPDPSTVLRAGRFSPSLCRSRVARIFFEPQVGWALRTRRIARSTSGAVRFGWLRGARERSLKPSGPSLSYLFRSL